MVRSFYRIALGKAVNRSRVIAVTGSLALAACATATTPPLSGPDRAREVDRFVSRSYPDAARIDYALAWHDLDGDGADEAIVYLAGPYFCGTGGCTLLVLTRAGPAWRKVGDTSTVRAPIQVLVARSHGWRDLAVEVAGGGGPVGTVALRFDGAAYSGNASIAAPTRAEGAELIGRAPGLRTAGPG